MCHHFAKAWNDPNCHPQTRRIWFRWNNSGTTKALIWNGRKNCELLLKLNSTLPKRVVEYLARIMPEVFLWQPKSSGRSATCKGRLTKYQWGWMYIFKPKFALLTLRESEKFKSSMYALQSFQPTKWTVQRNSSPRECFLYHNDDLGSIK